MSSRSQEAILENAGAIPRSADRQGRQKAKGRPKPSEIDLEPLRQVAEEFVLTGYGATIMVYERLSALAKEARETGEAHRDDAGPLARFLLDLVSKRPEVEPSVKVKVPVLPITDYDSLTVPQVKAQLAGLTDEQLRVVRDYEAAHKNRQGVLRAIDQRLAN